MAKYTAAVRFLFSIWIFFPGCDSYVTCKDDNGVTVDWYIIYKYPSRTGDGLEYLYMDNSTDGWTLSSKIISKSGALLNTLKPLLDFYVLKTEGFGYLLYNDQPPGRGAASSSYGHSKGVVMLDKQSGVWLSHSTPRFPTYHNRNFWPNNGNVNAQTFLCVTYPYDSFIDIGVQLKYIPVYPFDSHIPPTFHEELQCLTEPGCFPTTEPWKKVVTLTSIAGHHFYSVAKNKHFGDDLYSGLISKRVKGNLYVKSWGKAGRSKLLSSDCSIPNRHVHHVKTVKLLQGASFPNTVDHSKWCVSEGSITCIADMNRIKSQKERGGGAICIGDPVVREAFHALIRTYEPCEKPG